LEADKQVDRPLGRHENSLPEPVVHRPYLITAGLRDSRDLGVNVPREEKAFEAMIGMDFFQKVKGHENFLNRSRQEIVFEAPKLITWFGCLSKKAKLEYLRILSAHGAGIMGHLLLAADAMASELP